MTFPEMKIDNAPFPVRTIDLNNAKVLIRPEQDKGAMGKNVIIGETRPKNVDDKILDREVVLDRTPDGKESVKVTIKAHVPRGMQILHKTRVGLLSRHDRSDWLLTPVRIVSLSADVGHSNRSARKWVLRR